MRARVLVLQSALAGCQKNPGRVEQSSGTSPSTRNIPADSHRERTHDVFSSRLWSSSPRAPLNHLAVAFELKNLLGSRVGRPGLGSWPYSAPYSSPSFMGLRSLRYARNRPIPSWSCLWQRCSARKRRSRCKGDCVEAIKRTGRTCCGGDGGTGWMDAFMQECMDAWMDGLPRAAPTIFVRVALWIRLGSRRFSTTWVHRPPPGPLALSSLPLPDRLRLPRCLVQ